MWQRTRTRSRQAFTLVELLVVIGIIAIMISILMPALNRARDKARGVQCMSNMRQIYMACQMFAQDNKGHLPRPSWAGDSNAVVEFQNWNTYIQNDANGGLVNYEFDAGLMRFVSGVEARKNLFLCPGDNGEPMRYGSLRPVTGGQERNFSYSFHAYTGDRGDANLSQYRIDTPNPRPTGYKPGIRLGSVKSAANRIYIWEEVGPNDGWCLHPMDDTFRGIVANQDDVPSGRHGGQKALNAGRDQPPGSPGYNQWLKAGSGNFCFFDGHVEALAPGQILLDRRRENYYLPLFGQ